MPKTHLIQMAGHGGCGKSTLARQIARRVGGVVFDLDIIKTALLDAGLSWDDASKGSYATIYALVDDALTVPGLTVIVDTPSYWKEIHERLTTAADRHEATYGFVECSADEVVRAQRLASRPTVRSQIRLLGENAVDAPADLPPIHHRPIQPPDGRKCVLIDTNLPVNADDVLRLLEG